MFAWNAASRRWYLEAAKAGSYHRELAMALAPYLRASDEVAEFGCGLGCLALELAGLARSVTALDADGDCLALACEEQRRRQVKNLTFKTCDVFALPRDACWDVVVACLFGSPGENPELFTAHARRRVLCLVDTGGRKKTSMVPAAVSRRKVTGDETAMMLAGRGTAFQRRDLVFEFGQPLRDRAEARAFLRNYSVGEVDDQTLDMHLDQRLARTEKGLYLPHAKRLSLFALPGAAR